MSEESNQFNFRFQCQTKILETDLEMELKFQATRISVCCSKKNCLLPRLSGSEVKASAKGLAQWNQREHRNRESLVRLLMLHLNNTYWFQLSLTV